MAIVSLLKLPFLLPQSLDIEATDGVHFVSANRNANINDTDSSFGIVISWLFAAPRDFLLDKIQISFYLRSFVILFACFCLGREKGRGN